jgi:uncharacterized membrane protein YfcA
MIKIIIIVTSILFALLRIFGIKHEAFQAFAHLWVAGIFAIWLGIKYKKYFENDINIYLLVSIILAIIELLCFIAGFLHVRS